MFSTVLRIQVTQQEESEESKYSTLRRDTKRKNDHGHTNMAVHRCSSEASFGELAIPTEFIHQNFTAVVSSSVPTKCPTNTVFLAAPVKLATINRFGDRIIGTLYIFKFQLIILNMIRPADMNRPGGWGPGRFRTRCVLDRRSTPELGCCIDHRSLGTCSYLLQVC